MIQRLPDRLLPHQFDDSIVRREIITSKLVGPAGYAMSVKFSLLNGAESQP